MANQIRPPKAVRAIAGAFAAYKLPMAIPCIQAVILDGVYQDIAGVRTQTGTWLSLMQRTPT